MGKSIYSVPIFIGIFCPISLRKKPESGDMYRLPRNQAMNNGTAAAQELVLSQSDVILEKYQIIAPQIISHMQTKK